MTFRTNTGGVTRWGPPASLCGNNFVSTCQTVKLVRTTCNEGCDLYIFIGKRKIPGCCAFVESVKVKVDTSD